ncbi:MAG: histidine phosphatase family protein [Acidobacteriota bacterium]
MSTQATQGIFIRHGQSVANVGLWDGPFAEIPLTEVGRQQAEELAQSWDFVPDFIAVSPFVRTRQTAAPTIARFAQVPMEYWPIQEFTFWDRAFWGEMTPEEDQETVFKFWDVADPEHRYGTGAESFGDLLGRAEDSLERLAKMKPGSRVLLFTHGHFIQALRHVLLFPHWSAREKMQSFRGFDERWRVRNVELARAELKDGIWKLHEEDTQPEWRLESAAGRG